MFTCKDAQELQRRIEKNLIAIEKTVPVLREAMEDLDEDLSIEQASNLKSQCNGLIQMINEAKSRRVHIFGEPGETP